MQGRLAAMPGIEVHAVSTEGKLIVTIEAAGDKETVELYEWISQLDEVMSVAMVYHQKEEAPEEIISVEASPAGDATALA